MAMNNWQKTLIEAIRNDYVRYHDQSCVYQYFSEKALGNPRVQVKKAWAEGCSGAELAKLLATLASGVSQPADLEGIEFLSGVDLAGAQSKRQANAEVLKGLKRVADGVVNLALSDDDAVRIARGLCRKGGKTGKGTTVQAYSSLYDFQAGEHALIVGDELVFGQDVSEAELQNALAKCLRSESEQLLLNLGVPSTGREPLGAPRVSEVPTRLVELALTQIEGLPRKLGIAAAANTPSANQCSEADVDVLVKVLKEQEGVIVPVCMDALVGFSLCIVGKDFASGLSENRRTRFFGGAAPSCAFFVVVSQRMLNRFMSANREVPPEEYPTDDMIGVLWEMVGDAWIPGPLPAYRPVNRFAKLCEVRRHRFLKLYAAHNGSPSQNCPKPVIDFFESD